MGCASALSAETMLFDHRRVDIADLPWTDFQGRDNHLLRDFTTFDDQRGNGGGDVQVEGVLSYSSLTVSESASVAAYWAM